jgi:hypothetical protein
MGDVHAVREAMCAPASRAGVGRAPAMCRAAEKRMQRVGTPSILRRDEPILFEASAMRPRGTTTRTEAHL